MGNVEVTKKDDLYPIDTGRRELINQEQPKNDTIPYVFDPTAPKPNKNPVVFEQNDQAQEPSKETVRLRKYKKRQIEEYTTDFSINQIAPSPILTFLNVINTIILTIALVVAFFVAFGLMFGLKIGIVPTDSMEPNVHVGALVVIKPLNKIDDIRVGDVLSYVKTESGTTNKYIHRVESVAGNVITMKGDNENFTKRDYISFDAVEGRMIVNLAGVGYVVAFVRNNLLLVIPIIIVAILALMLGRIIMDRKQQKEQLDTFIDQRIAYENRMHQKLIEQKKKDAEKEIDNILQNVDKRG